MKLFIDGDAFPNLLKQIVFRAIERLKIKTLVIANKTITIGISDNIQYLVVNAGADEADDKIVGMVTAGDIVITADIPLADRVLTKGAYAIDHRGERFSEDNIKTYVAMRELMQSIRDNGEMTKGPKPFSKKDSHHFANQLDQLLTKLTTKQ